MMIFLLALLRPRILRLSPGGKGCGLSAYASSGPLARAPWGAFCADASLTAKPKMPNVAATANIANCLMSVFLRQPSANLRNMPVNDGLGKRHAIRAFRRAVVGQFQ